MVYVDGKFVLARCPCEVPCMPSITDAIVGRVLPLGEDFQFIDYHGDDDESFSKSLSEIQPFVRLSMTMPLPPLPIGIFACYFCGFLFSKPTEVTSHSRGAQEFSSLERSIIRS